MPLQIILVLHIICGGIALLVAPLAMLVKKGGRWHKNWGRAYCFAMTGVFITATIIGLVKQNYFLLSIGVFSYYFVISGWRIVYLKKKDVKITLLDKVVVVSSGLVYLAMLLVGTISILSKAYNFGHIVMIVFSIIGFTFVSRDAKILFQNTIDKRNWMLRHINAMGGGYIATVTAFVVVNNHGYFPPMIAWLGPSLIGTIILIRTGNKLKSKSI